MINTFLVLLPPLFVVAIAATTRKIVPALLVGIFSAAMIVHDFSVVNAVVAMVKKVWVTTELGTVTSFGALLNTWYLLIVLFLLLIGILIVLITDSGAAHAYGNVITKKLKTKKQAEASSLLLSLIFFIDDYFSCLTVGSVMQGITDRFKIPRVKLAFLVNAMAAPLVVLLPVSSWVAEIMMQLKVSGVSSTATAGTMIVSDPLYIYTRVIPFIFYAIISIASVWFMVMRRISFGVIAEHEKIAEQTGNLFAGKDKLALRKKESLPAFTLNATLKDFLIPIGLLVGTVFVGILYFGDFVLFGGERGLVDALQNASTAAALFIGALITIFASFIYLAIRKLIKPKQIPGIVLEGIQLMGPSTLILILIWTLSTLLKVDLATGDYLASLLIGNIPVALLPVLFFIVAAVTATTMGSAWGSIGILIPIGLPMLANMSSFSVPVEIAYLPIVFPLVGAIVSGAVVGNHLSPISDTMLMSSTSARAYHIDLVRAQFQFTIPTVVSTAIGFLLAGILMSMGFATWLVVVVSLGSSLLINIGILHQLQGQDKK